MLLFVIFFVAFVCGVLLFCVHHWLKTRRIHSTTRTMAVFAVGDLDINCGTEGAVSPTVGFHFQTQKPACHPIPCFGTLGPPPSYEDVLKNRV
ncbi:transmembrane protein 207 [Octodon degus]|uniref:Transmembrane protein 207 n=1 Tax=Octodon degus TaxID=10160 RepID=A0A6P6DAJ7_OCTDE|nr:transmembrane protein 207 [Octodon degus]